MNTPIEITLNIQILAYLARWIRRHFIKKYADFIGTHIRYNIGMQMRLELIRINYIDICDYVIDLS